MRQFEQLELLYTSLGDIFVLPYENLSYRSSNYDNMPFIEAFVPSTTKRVDVCDLKQIKNGINHAILITYLMFFTNENPP